MQTRTFLILSVCQFLLGILVGVSAPLFPLYLKHLGAGPVQMGYFLSITGLFSFLFPIAIGRAADILGRPKLLLAVSSALSAPLIWAAAYVPDLFTFGLLMIPSGALSMAGFSLINTLSGLYADTAVRGTIFARLRTVRSVGAIVGGVFSGKLVDLYGYGTFFWTLSAAMALIALFALGLEERRNPAKTGQKIDWGLNLGRDFYYLTAAAVFFAMADRIKGILLPLYLEDLGFTVALITLASSVFRIVGLPLTLYLGVISDRYGRKRVLMLAFLGYACYFFLMTVAHGVIDIFAVQVLRVVVAIIQAVGAAYVADLIAPELLGTGMAIFQGAAGLGGILGATLTGHSAESLGIIQTFYLGGVLALLGVAALARSRQSEA